MPKTGNYYAHTYGTNSNKFDFSESDTKNPGYHTFEFNLDKSDLKFSPHNEYLEFALVSYGDDKHIFFRKGFRVFTQIVANYLGSHGLTAVIKSAVFISPWIFSYSAVGKIYKHDLSHVAAVFSSHNKNLLTAL